jgi:hypothetical protein
VCIRVLCFCICMFIYTLFVTHSLCLFWKLGMYSKQTKRHTHTCIIKHTHSLSLYLSLSHTHKFTHTLWVPTFADWSTGFWRSTWMSWHCTLTEYTQSTLQGCRPELWNLQKFTNIVNKIWHVSVFSWNFSWSWEKSRRRFWYPLGCSPHLFPADKAHQPWKKKEKRKQRSRTKACIIV